jgi:hypothetical protein
VNADPGCAMVLVYAYAAAYCLTQENADAWKQVRPLLKAAQCHLIGITKRERLYIQAIALLLRLELRGVDVGDRWQDLSNYLYARIDEHALPFQDLHYIYALARASKSDWVNQMQLSMQNHALMVNPYLRQNWLEIAIPAARGMVAYAKGDYSTAKSELKAVLPLLHRIGGSHAQRVLFEQVYRDAVWHSEKQSQMYAMAV